MSAAGEASEAGATLRRFATLYGDLDAVTGTHARVDLLAAYFREATPEAAAWALPVLLGRQRRRLITGRRLRQICLEGSPLPDWLFDDCYAQVGDSAETIALLWCQFAPAQAASSPSLADLPLAHWMGELLPGAAALAGEAQAEAVRTLWSGLSPGELLVANKLLTGGLRVGVAQGLVVRALSRVSGVEEPLLVHRLMGGFQPSGSSFAALIGPAAAGEAEPSRPYPFFLASTLERPAVPGAAPLPGSPGEWLVEWKWDGIRAQMIRRAGQSFLWSRGEELINAAFPDLIGLAEALPEGTVLDGEITVWLEGEDRPAPFAQLQRRLGRRAPGRGLLAECPAALVAYDLLEHGGRDQRHEPLRQRRGFLEDLHRQVLAGPCDHGRKLRLSPRQELDDWGQLEALRSRARVIGAEGLMLKATGSPYLAGRRRGHWWKHKLEPHCLDAVLVYAQAGSGRRANLFTDYTFALWDRPPERTPGTGSGSAARLVTFAKAYSGLDDGEIQALDRWIRSHTLERFGPVRAVEPVQVFELAFEGLQRSSRHRSGLAVRFPRIRRWRRDKPAAEADSLDSALALLAQDPLSGTPADRCQAAG